MNFGIFYQSGYNYNACYHALKQLRQIYKYVPIALFEDGSKDLVEVSKKFTCYYKPIESKKINWGEEKCGRPYVGDINETYKWLSRIYDACVYPLKDVNWIILYEDDVWCRREIVREPHFDLSGDNGPFYSKSLHDLLKMRTIYDCGRYGACGGTIFKRDCFLQCYKNFWNIDWEYINSLDSRVIEWCDANLSFLFQWNNFSTGKWSEMFSKEFDKFSNNTNLQDVAFLHGYKYYYDINGNVSR